MTDSPERAVVDWLRAIADDRVEEAWTSATLEARLVLVIWLDGPALPEVAALGPAHPRWAELRSSVRQRFANDGGAALRRFLAAARVSAVPWRGATPLRLVAAGWQVVTVASGPAAIQFCAVRRDGDTDRTVRWRVGPPGGVPRTVEELQVLAREKARAAESPIEAIMRRHFGG